jgi:hypothetical protein
MSSLLFSGTRWTDLSGSKQASPMSFSLMKAQMSMMAFWLMMTLPRPFASAMQSAAHCACQR